MHVAQTAITVMVLDHRTDMSAINGLTANEKGLTIMQLNNVISFK